MKGWYRSGFTLIELLVVLAVIAVIAAILLPVFAQAREKARAAACLSNLHQIALASELYTQDYDETFLWNPIPGIWTGSSTAALILKQTGQQRDCVDQPLTSWVVELRPYLNSDGVYRCPSYAGIPRVQFWSYARSLDPARFRGIGYGLNDLLIGDPCRPHSVVSLRHSPSDVTLVGDSSMPWSSIWVNHRWEQESSFWESAKDQQEWQQEPPPNLYWAWQNSVAPPWAPSLHVGGANFAFADGHARFLHPSLPVLILPPVTSDAIARSADVAGGVMTADRLGYFPDALLE